MGLETTMSATKVYMSMAWMAYLHAGGDIPPVNMVAYGNATPATCPSTSRRTSRNGPCPRAKPVGKSGTNWLAMLKYCEMRYKHQNCAAVLRCRE